MTGSFRRAACAAAVAVTVLCAAPGAHAATITQVGGILTYTGADAVSNVSFDQIAPTTIRVDRDLAGSPPDDDAVSSFPASCNPVNPTETYDCTGVTALVADGNGGDDAFEAILLETIPATLNGGPGDDDLDGGDAVDTVAGQAGLDNLSGGPAADALDGGTDADIVGGGGGVDVLRGGDGDDVMFGGGDNDTLLGEGGNDLFAGEPGDDDVSGGAGTDTANAFHLVGPAPDVLVTLDDAANDRLTGAGGEADNIRADVENVETEMGLFSQAPTLPSANDTLVGNAAANTLSGFAGNDTLEGGTNNDVLNGGEGNDALRARDGFADVVNCGAGADTADVDTLDTVSECETVTSVDAGNANDLPEDAPPAVALTGPGSGALLRTAGPTEVTATATDDKGIAQVLFVDDDRVVCADTSPPYACAYQPRGEDVGRNTLVAIAVDTAQQTASTTRAFNVDRFAVAGITGAVTPARDVRAPFVFRTSGRLRLPPFVLPALGCADGQVSVQVKAGSKTISTRRADLRRDCTFASTVCFANRSRFTRNGRLRFTLRFTGNEILNRSAAVARNVRTRS